jgi:hypothetical protein
MPATVWLVLFDALMHRPLPYFCQCWLGQSRQRRGWLAFQGRLLLQPRSPVAAPASPMPATMGATIAPRHFFANHETPIKTGLSPRLRAKNRGGLTNAFVCGTLIIASETVGAQVGITTPLAGPAPGSKTG